MLQKIIYKLGVKWRNPSLLRQFESLKKSDKWSIEKLQAYQFERLKTLLQFAYDHSPFYKKEFDEVGFHPSQMTSPDDMKVLPVIDKSSNFPKLRVLPESPCSSIEMKSGIQDIGPP